MVKVNRHVRWCLGAMLVLLAAALTACGGSSSDTTTSAGQTPSDGQTSTAAAAAVDENATLRVVDVAEPRSLDPAMATLKNDQRQGTAIVEYLVRTDDQFQLTRDGLVTDWRRVKPTEWHFTLRDGVTFSDGEPLDAAAARFSLLFERDRSFNAPYFSDIVDVRVVDPQTFAVITRVPRANIPATLAAAPALPPRYFRRVGVRAFDTKPVGTGPFTLKQWTAGQSLELVRNPDYWGGPAPVAGITFTWAPDATARSSLLESGAVDIATLVPPQSLDTLGSGDQIQLSSGPTNRLAGMMFGQPDKPPFDDPALRVAVAQAIDRDALASLYYDGKGGVPWRSIYSPSFPESERDHPYIEYDPDAATAAVRKAVAAGTSVKIALNWPQNQNPVIDDTAKALGDMLRKVGFDVKLAPLEYAEFNDKFFTRDFAALALSTFGYPYPGEEAIFRVMLGTRGLAPVCGPNPEGDALVERALSATDQADVEAAFRDADELMTARRPCWMPVYNLVDIWGLSDKVDGFQPRVDELIDWHALRVTT